MQIFHTSKVLFLRHRNKKIVLTTENDLVINCDQIGTNMFFVRFLYEKLTGGGYY